MTRRGDLIGLQDDCLIAIQDGRPIPEQSLRLLPPWRAVLMADVAVRAGCFPAEAAASLRQEAIEIGGTGTLSAGSVGYGRPDEH